MSKVGAWVRLMGSAKVGQVLEVEALWGSEVLRVWLPSDDTTVRVTATQVTGLESAEVTGGALRLVATAAAARIVDALAQDVLVAPLEANVTPLPHQLHALSRAFSGGRLRYLLADEVGLGKTIEAGLVLRELKLRGQAQRILVVAPMGLCKQWAEELRVHFREDFRLLLPAQFDGLRELGGFSSDDNLWRRFDQVICPVDSLKPLDARRGWSPERLARYNRERFEDLVTAGWDLIIVDEAHRLAGSTTEVARYKLGEALSLAAPYLLLLSATPHQGKTDAFRRLLAFLDPEAFPDDDAVRQERVAPYVIRTEKRQAIDAKGNPLFKPRRTQLVPVSWAGREDQRALYDAVTDYVRLGYNRAVRERRTAIGFLMILMQRMVTSSTRAIRYALERRLAVLEAEPQLPLLAGEGGPRHSRPSEETWNPPSELEGEELDQVLEAGARGQGDERHEVAVLLSAARRCEAHGTDVKVEALLGLMRDLEREENDPEARFLIFTEFVPTQELLAEVLTRHGYSVVCLNGSLGMDQRRAVQQAFRTQARVLLSTDAGGEGLNLQFCHVIVNYDLPWNPMKLEQRIGRVDRIGQPFVVRAFNLALEESVELRIREVLEEKLARILEEFGVDKLSDVLDGEDAAFDFDTLYVQGLLDPADVAARAEVFAAALQERADAVRAGTRVLGSSGRPDPGLARQLEDHQLPFWTEQLVTAWLRVTPGGAADRRAEGWSLWWPPAEGEESVTFTRVEAERTGLPLVSLEDPRVRSLLSKLPRFAPGQPIPGVTLEGISDKVTGLWSLWRVSLEAEGGRQQRMLPVFLTEDGRALGPTARAVWDRLVSGSPEDLPGLPPMDGVPASAAYAAARSSAESLGSALFGGLRAAHQAALDRDRKKGDYAFSSRRRAIHKLGLANVRAHRLAQLEREEAAWRSLLEDRAPSVPELVCLAMVRVGLPGVPR